MSCLFRTLRIRQDLGTPEQQNQVTSSDPSTPQGNCLGPNHTEAVYQPVYPHFSGGTVMDESQAPDCEAIRCEVYAPNPNLNCSFTSSHAINSFTPVQNTSLYSQTVTNEPGELDGFEIMDLDISIDDDQLIEILQGNNKQ